MLWLDSTYPPEKDGQPGAARGPCAQDSGVPAEVESSMPNAYVSAPKRNDEFCADMSVERLSGPTSASGPSAPPSRSRSVHLCWSSWVRSCVGALGGRSVQWGVLLFFVYVERDLLYARFVANSNIWMISEHLRSGV